MSAFRPFELSPDALEDLRDLLGDNLATVLRFLEAAATAYSVSRRRESDDWRSRRQLQALHHTVEVLLSSIATLSPEATRMLERQFDFRAPVLGTRGDQTLMVVREASERLQFLLAGRKRMERNESVVLLGTVIGLGFAEARIPLSKGRNGLFGRVLAVVWHDVDPNSAREESVRSVNRAVGLVLRGHKDLTVKKGRPKKSAR